MHTLGETIDRRPALPVDSLCEAALGVFVHEPDCRVLAVADDGKPLGVIAREPFMARMEAPGAQGRAITEAFEPDLLLADAAEPISAFLERALDGHAAALAGGFVVTEGGTYAGVCEVSRLLPGLLSAQRQVAMIERMCQEVREPVAHALTAAEALQRLRLPNAAAAHIETIAEAAGTTLSLLDIAAELQRAELGRLEVSAAPRRLQELMDELEARWRAQAELAGATLLVSYDGTPDCAAVIDAGRLMQVFDALIGHAMAHAGRGVIEASLQVKAAVSGFQLTGRVRDNAAYESQHLADLFCAHPELAEDGGMGLQLELMLAQRNVEAMGGALEAKANPGPGATVSFEVAAAAVEHETQAQDTVAPREHGRSAHILVVDDNATNRMVVEALCEMFDCSTESVADGVEAVEAAKGGRFDVILMDIKMPRMDGVTATREIRKLAAPAGRVPIIALTANADADEVAQYMAAGMRSVVEKPIKPERLMEALDAVLSGDNGAGHKAHAA